eukprot:TRINITY_DN4009_c0_g1_i2.p1 TRINITY_DN4009_c0_g1~~TRINITY_DN4009_c0_g1_i2.p1  ORF type:complete len:374 (-),score=59.09 TRINITY_DN4009_c0_g1_i2:1033-2154(-)
MREYQLLTLAGRRVGYAEYGRHPGRGASPARYHVLYCHGLPGSRLDARLSDALCDEAEVHVVAVDRPGFGLSDYDAARRLTDFVPVAAAVADACFGAGVRFAVVGVSGGAPYALAVAAVLPKRVEACVVAAGFGLRYVHSTAALPSYRAFLALARCTPRPLLPALSRALTRRYASHDACRRSLMSRPAVLAGMDALAASLESDAATKAKPDQQAEARRTVCLEWMVDSTVEAFRHGSRGPLLDAKLLASPWGFTLENVRVPVLWLHGKCDDVVPWLVGRGTALHLPRCCFTATPLDTHYTVPLCVLLRLWPRIVTRDWHDNLSFSIPDDQPHCRVPASLSTSGVTGTSTGCAVLCLEMMGASRRGRMPRGAFT